MDDTKRVIVYPAEDEFSRQYEKTCKEENVPLILASCREEAIFRTFEKYQKYLDRVMVQKMKNGPIGLTYQIYSDLFVDPKQEFFWKMISDGQIAIVEPYVKYLEPQIFKHILQGLSAKIKSGFEGKIILPD